MTQLQEQLLDKTTDETYLSRPSYDKHASTYPDSHPNTLLSLHKPHFSPSSSTPSVTSHVTPTKPPVTPLPKTQLALLGACLYGVLFSQNVLFPFLPFMVASFFPDLLPSELGYRAGYLGAAFPAGLALSSYGWGRIADRIGRKPCLLVGLVTTYLAITAFGFSESFIVALTWRFLAGALNGNNGIVKTMVSEVCDDSNMATGFSLIGLLGGLARATSPAIGGYLAEPSKQYEVFRGVGWLERWPYALPCVVGGGIAGVSLVLVTLFLNETLPDAVRRESWSNIKARCAALTRCCAGNSEHNRLESERATGLLHSASPPAVESTTTTPPASIRSLLTMPTVSIAIYLNAIMAFLAIVQTEVIPLWVILTPEEGGFNMSPTAIATLLMLLGPFQMAHQVLIYPRLTARYGSKQLFRYALTGVGVFCSLMPFTAYLNRLDDSGWLSWVGLTSCFIVMVLFRVTSFTCCFVLLNNACVPAIKATANGLAQSTASLAQIVGPVLGALLFAWSVGVGVWPIDFGLVWQVQAVVCVMGVWLCGRLPDSVNRKAEVVGSDTEKEKAGESEVGEVVGGAVIRVESVEESKEGPLVSEGRDDDSLSLNVQDVSVKVVARGEVGGQANDMIELIIRPSGHNAHAMR